MLQKNYTALPFWLRTLPCGALETNAYLCGRKEGREAVLVDAPPDSVGPVQSALAEFGRELSALIVTHPHFDHVLDAAAFSALGVPVYAHGDAVEGIQSPDTMGFFPQPPGGFPRCAAIETLPLESDVSLGGLTFRVLDVPGHSEGSVALFLDSAEHPLCFVGDLVFRRSVGRTDLPDASFDTLVRSIREKIYSLPDHTVLLPGHGPATDVAFEKRYNPFVPGV